MANVCQMKRAQEILDKLRKGTSSADEKRFLNSWIDEFQHPEAKELSDAVLEKSLNRFKQRVQANLNKPTIYFRYASAAILLLCFSLGIYLFWAYRKDQLSEEMLVVAPAKGRAVLSFENGERMNLNEDSQDTTLKDMGIQISKDTLNGLTIIQAGNLDNPIVYHTIKTPFAGVVKLNLEDGTVLDINAGTTVRFPSTFKGLSRRHIHVDGEVFLSVAHDKEKPFHVFSNNQLIEVLGTKFNINTYKAHEMRTTLLTGSVKVVVNGGEEQALFLKPGEQAVVGRSAGYKSRISLEKELDWKNGEFYFEDSPIAEVMDKLARWYDVDVEIAPSANKLRLNGIISRKRSLQEVLKLIEKTGKINIRLVERRIYVK